MSTKIVLSGAPYSGKTTLLNTLQQKGFFCIEEIATQLIQEKNKKIGVEQQVEWLKNNYSKFQEEVLNKQIQEELKVKNKHELIVCDRGVIDIMAFSILRNIPIPDIMYKYVENCSYDYSFILPLLPSFCERPETGRTITKQEAEKLEKILIEMYQKHCKNVYILPAANTEKQASIIQNFIQNKEEK